MNRPRPRFRSGPLTLAAAVLLLAPVAPGLTPAASAAGPGGYAAQPDARTVAALAQAPTPTPATPTPTPNPTPTPTPTPPNPTPTSTAPHPTDPPSPTPTTRIRCSATWKLVSQWPGAFHAEVTVHSTGTAPVARWAVRLPLAEGQGVRDIWSATISSTIDDVVTIGNTEWNGQIAPGGSTTFGLIGTGPATAPTLSCIAV